MNFQSYKNEVDSNGFSILPDIYNITEITAIINAINIADSNSDTFRKSVHLFAIRQFLKEVPAVAPLVFNRKLKDVIHNVFGKDYFVIKSIYFDKPGASNWFVAYHRDLTISVKDKIETSGYGPWTVKQNQFAVQPPLEILENIYTIRIHLDDTDEANGALKVIPGSHTKGIYRPETINRDTETEVSCNVPAGGIMLMKPLLMHSSARTLNNYQRRVIHIEFSEAQLSRPLGWSEQHFFNP